MFLSSFIISNGSSNKEMNITKDDESDIEVRAVQGCRYRTCPCNGSRSCSCRRRCSGSRCCFDVDYGDDDYDDDYYWVRVTSTTTTTTRRRCVCRRRGCNNCRC